MKQLRLFILLFILANASISNAQYTNNIWCFGDSAGINFNTVPPTPFPSGLLTKNGSSSIADINGNLLFYGSSFDDSTNSSGSNESAIIKDRTHQTMQNGTNLIGDWYHTMTIVPKSVSDSTFYVFTAGVVSDVGLYYSIVDLKLNNGLGAVIQKNVQLDSFPLFDGITAIKNGSATGWWLTFQRGSLTIQDSSDEYFQYAVDSNGISNKTTQHIGVYKIDGAGDLSFNTDGTKLIYVGWGGLIELFDFDRYTGIISTPITIESGKTSGNFPYYASTVFSPNNRFLYLTSDQTGYQKASCLYQYDLFSLPISSSRTLIDSFPFPTSMDFMEVGADKKIYVTAYDEHYGFPYPDSIHNVISDNLSVINYPDSLGAACDFQPFSFYLGGNRGAIGLPNNPDYTLGPLDTLTAVHEIKNTTQLPNTLKIFYHTSWDIAFINADKLQGKKYALSVFDITGKLIFKEEGNLTSQYFTKDLSMNNFSKGMYIVVLQTEKEKLSARFVK